jgi:peroxiredoxin Q/BCP
MLRAGDRAPDFSFPSTAGKIIRLRDFKGMKIVLYFYPKDLTPGCTTEACSFQEHLPALKEKGAVVVGVSADPMPSHAKFAAD